ncbi:hypothetical protein [Streptosporangium roseum]|uniref:hypothetical protein n=1 Tax=Streptosporangium roseum TaxID=2001 RepID=UPI003331EB6A
MPGIKNIVTALTLSGALAGGMIGLGVATMATGAEAVSAVNTAGSDWREDRCHGCHRGKNCRKDRDGHRPKKRNINVNNNNNNKKKSRSELVLENHLRAR